MAALRLTKKQTEHVLSALYTRYKVYDWNEEDRLILGKAIHRVERYQAGKDLE